MNSDIRPFEFERLTYLIQKTIETRGSQYPNPAVGAMLINHDEVISEGFHHLHGHDHAELIALKKAGNLAKGATLLITLEPCVHQGKTPPCVDAIIHSGVTRVLWAMDDPNPQVHGKAKRLLEAHSIQVHSHCLPDLALECVKEFNTFHKLSRPYVYVKAAVSLDGMIAPHSNGLTYISSQESLQVVQMLRTHIQAICVGANTVNVDQPRLSIRINQIMPFQPTIVILDPRNIIDMDWVKKMLGIGRKIMLFRSQDLSQEYEGLCVDSGLSDDKLANWKYLFQALHHQQIHGLLVEGGTSVFQSILGGGYFDELWITKVPHIFGTTAVPFISAGSSIPLDVSLHSSVICGSDVVIKYRKNHAFSI